MFRNFLPICLNISKYKILIVGGGKAASQKLRHLVTLNCQITVVAQKVSSSIKDLSKAKKISLYIKNFKDTDIKGYDLVYACTDNLDVNRRIAYLAKQKGLLCNMAGDNSLSSFFSPAVYRNKKYLVCVSTFGKNPKLSIQLRDQIKKYLKT